jgi:hypothetical protein
MLLDGAFGGRDHAVVSISITRLERNAATATGFRKYKQQIDEMLNAEA